MMLEQFPEWAEKIHYWHVDDMDCATADEALPICESCVKVLVRTLLAEQKKQKSPARVRREAATSKIVFGLQRQSRNLLTSAITAFLPARQADAHLGSCPRPVQAI